MRWKVIIEYDGTNYHGMQKQKNLSTIQGKIEEILKQLLNQQIAIDYSGRTDAGVHALGQVIHFDLEKEFKIEKMISGMNFYLKNEQISAISAEIVSNNFHSRFSAKKRKYVYKILNRNVHSPILKNRALHISCPLNIEKMQIAANLIVGKTLDYSAFRSSECQAKNPIRTINLIQFEKQSDEISVHFEAKSFLHHMIRIMIGVFLKIGSGKWPPEKILEIVNFSAFDFDKIVVGPHGLFFAEVCY